MGGCGKKTMTTASVSAQLLETIKTLNSTVWENRVQRPRIDSWLNGFSGGDDERLNALFLLSQMIYFGDNEIREALRSIYRDLFRYPIVAHLRRSNADTADTALLDQLFRLELNTTRFLGVGNPSESGTHLLYFFRQENALPSNVFIHTHEIFTRSALQPHHQLRQPAVRRYIFLDDLCASGHQAIEYSREVVELAKAIDATLRFSYYPIIATQDGLARIRNHAMFDEVEAVFEIDSSYKCFENTSRHFADPPAGVTLQLAYTLARVYGHRLEPTKPLGYADGQLLLAFHHNTPDNTLPIMWSDTGGWVPPFRRYPKWIGSTP
jgi:hypothetical protein